MLIISPLCLHMPVSNYCYPTFLLLSNFRFSISLSLPSFLISLFPFCLLLLLISSFYLSCSLVRFPGPTLETSQFMTGIRWTGWLRTWEVSAHCSLQAAPRTEYKIVFWRLSCMCTPYTLNTQVHLFSRYFGRVQRRDPVYSVLQSSR